MHLIGILEDNQDRVTEMRRALQTIGEAEAVFLDNAPDMIRWLRDHEGAAAILSLDHDLDPLFERDGRSADPGDGRDVARFLATQQPCCPVILHSTNSQMVSEMESHLSAAGWECVRVVPFAGMAWIASTWLSAIRDRLPSPS